MDSINVKIKIETFLLKYWCTFKKKKKICDEKIFEIVTLIKDFMYLIYKNNLKTVNFNSFVIYTICKAGDYSSNIESYFILINS